VPATRSVNHKLLSFRCNPFQLNVLPIINAYILVYSVPAARSDNPNLLHFRSIPSQLHVLPILISYIFGLFPHSYTFCQTKTLKFSVYSVPATRSATHNLLNFRSIPCQLHVLPTIYSYIFYLFPASYTFCQ